MKLRTLSRALLGLILLTAPAFGRSPGVEQAKAAASTQVKRMLEPILEKFCQEDCKLLSVQANVDLEAPEQFAPGFDGVDADTQTVLAPNYATVKLLINKKIGPVSRKKLLDLLQQHLDTLEFPVRIDSQLAAFPEPLENASRLYELKEKATTQFKGAIDALFKQFCPGECMLADYEIAVEPVNPEEAQYGQSGEYLQDGQHAIRIKNISATFLMDENLPDNEQENIMEMAKLKTNFFRNVTLNGKTIGFPSRGAELNADGTPRLLGPLRDGYGRNRSEKNDQNSTSKSSDSRESKESLNQSHRNDSRSSNSSRESNDRKDKHELHEKIERVEQGDAIQEELKKFKLYGLVFACSILSLLIFILVSSLFGPLGKKGGVQKIENWFGKAAAPDAGAAAKAADAWEAGVPPSNPRDRVATNYAIDRLMEELIAVFAQQPRVAKVVFSRILTEEGVETTAKYMQMFGESIVMDMLKDPSLQNDLSELMEYYAKNPVDLEPSEQLDLLKKLHNRTVAGKLIVMGNRSSNLFDFLAEMDATQIYELVRTESVTVKAIVLTQSDYQKRTTLYGQFDEDVRTALLTELSRVDYLPRDFIFNVSNALKRKRRENPRLNTEALPGSEVLVSLLERTPAQTQRSVIKSLEGSSPESVRTLKSKLVSLDTLKFLKDNQLLEVILNLKHDELLIFLKGAPADVRSVVFAKSPRELVSDLEEELQNLAAPHRELYQSIERKVLNRLKVMATEGVINLIETNERMFASAAGVADVLGKASGW